MNRLRLIVAAAALLAGATTASAADFDLQDHYVCAALMVILAIDGEPGRGAALSLLAARWWLQNHPDVVPKNFPAWVPVMRAIWSDDPGAGLSRTIACLDHYERATMRR